MGKAVKTFSIIFLVLIGSLTFYQIIIGNPFFDEVPPVLVFIAATIMGILGLTAYILEKRRKKSADSE